MGTRLEKTSAEVRKRIESHTFHDEEGEEYEASKFGGFGDYMRRKKIKLQNLDAEIRLRSTDKPQIFGGVVVHVNGYTQPSLNDLHHLVVSHGGGFLQYLDGKTVATHVVASQLTPKKKVEFARYRIVKPAWIVDSVKAARLLPWDTYRVVDEGVTQKVLGFDNGHIVSQANSQRQGYRDQSETSWYTPHIRQYAQDLESKQQRERQPHHEQVWALRTGSDAQEQPPQEILEDKEDVEGLRPPVSEPAMSTAAGGDRAGRSGQTLASPEAGTMQRAQEDGMPHTPKETLLYEPSPEGHILPIERSKVAEKRKVTAEEHNAMLLSNPHLAKSSTANPDFLNQYYRESRLHHLSTWKAELKAQLQARAQEKSLSQRTTQKKIAGSRRYIMHVDFDSFFAAVSLRKYPQFIDKPVVIAHGSGPGSEIASCNYPARKFGVKNGMWMKSALGLCPDLKVLPYDFKAYEEASRHFYDSILAIEGIVQSISIDEALIDVSDQCLKAGGSEGQGLSEGSIYREHAKAQELAQALRASVKEKTGCDVSVGIGNNILLAKVALRKAKPAGQHLIKPDDVLDALGELVVTDLPGVAWSIGNKLEEIGIKYVKDIRALTKERLINALGPKTGEKIWDYSRGIDKQDVGEQAVRKSVSAEINWGIRFVTQQQAEEFVQCLCDELSKRLLEQTVKGRQLTMKIMRKAADADLDPPKSLGHGKCDTFNKSVALGVATHDSATLGKEAISILRSFAFPPGELRGLGVQMQKLEPLKPLASKSSNANPSDDRQRRLQFRKPDAYPMSVKSHHPAERDITPPPAATRHAPGVREKLDPIEEIVTSPEKQNDARTVNGSFETVLDAAGDNESKRKPLNISGTQFVLPSQVDPTVLAELPADIRAGLAPKQQSTVDIISRPAPTRTEGRSRSASPSPSGGEIGLPSQSQLDPETLNALPEDVRNEVLAHYQTLVRPGQGGHQQALLPQSPRKTNPFASKKLALTPTPTKKKKVNKATAPLGKGRAAKRGADAMSTLTQSNFVSMNKTKAEQATNVPVSGEEEISESFLNELPEDIRLEILAEQKRSRMRARFGLNFETGKKNHRGNSSEVVSDAARGQSKLRLPVEPQKPTFTSRKLSTLPELRDATSAWVHEFSSDGEAPDDDDVKALADYLCKVIAIENDMAKSVAVVNWVGYVIESQHFASQALQLAWGSALFKLKDQVQEAVRAKGLPPVAFES